MAAEAESEDDDDDNEGDDEGDDEDGGEGDTEGARREERPGAAARTMGRAAVKPSKTRQAAPRPGARTAPSAPRRIPRSMAALEPAAGVRGKPRGGVEQLVDRGGPTASRHSFVGRRPDRGTHATDVDATDVDGDGAPPVTVGGVRQTSQPAPLRFSAPAAARFEPPPFVPKLADSRLPPTGLGPLFEAVHRSMESGKAMERIPFLGQLASQLGLRNLSKDRAAFDEHAMALFEGSHAAAESARAAATVASRPDEREAYLRRAVLHYREAAESLAARKKVHDMSDVLGFKTTIQVLLKGNPQALLSDFVALDPKQRKRLLSNVLGPSKGRRDATKKRSKKSHKRARRSSSRRRSGGSSSSDSSSEGSSDSSSDSESSSSSSDSDGGRKGRRRRQRPPARTTTSRGRGDRPGRQGPRCRHCSQREHVGADCPEVGKMPEEAERAAASGAAAGQRGQRRN